MDSMGNRDEPEGRGHQGGETSPTDRVPDIAIVMPYYDNPQMWAYQLEHFHFLDPVVASRIEVVLVDDGSPLYPAATVPIGDLPFSLSIFRIHEDKPWNQDAARNIGVREARAPFVLVTDVDHIVPEETLRGLMTVGDHDQVFALGRGAHFSDAPVRSHVNSYFMARDLYWKIGGYDEDFWGLYGTDKLFRTRVLRDHHIVLRDDLVLELVTQGSIPDAKNKVFPRRPPLLRRFVGMCLRGLKSLGVVPNPVVLSNPYRRVYPSA
jgi:glycosyltransferase involved in cell wall biosynthesis